MPEHPSDRLINLFGALSLGVSDQIRGAAASAMSAGGETAAALVVVGHAPGLSIDQLSRGLRLSHPGTVRLVDRLVALGLVERRPSAADRRSTSLELTAAGTDQREALLALRRNVLADLLNLVPIEDRPALERIAERIVGSLPQDALSALTTCRFCDERRCLDCPMDVFGTLGAPIGKQG